MNIGLFIICLLIALVIGVLIGRYQDTESQIEWFVCFLISAMGILSLSLQ